MREIKKSDIKKGFRFNWIEALNEDFFGVYEVICYRKDLSEIFCYKPGHSKESTIGRDGQLAKFDERIINNEDFLALSPERKQTEVKE